MAKPKNKVYKADGLWVSEVFILRHWNFERILFRTRHFTRAMQHALRNA